jgi:2'-5' RNA ligase
LKLFFAVWPNEEVRAHLEATQAKLVRLHGGQTTTPATFHLTLCYLGEITPSRLDALMAIGASIDQRGFELKFDKVGCFEKAKVGWAGTRQIAHLLIALQTALQQAIAAAAFPVDPRPFRPHITLVRKLPQAFETMSAQETRWYVNSFSLVVSLPDEAGVRYEVLKTWPLRV